MKKIRRAVFSYSQASNVYSFMNRDAEALEQWHKTMNMDPNFESVHEELVEFYLSKHKFEQAFAEVKALGIALNDVVGFVFGSVTIQSFGEGSLLLTRVWRSCDP